MSAGDFNGDGYPDVAVTNNSSSSVSVFINNGDGTFVTKVDYTTASSPYDVTSADLNSNTRSRDPLSTAVQQFLY